MRAISRINALFISSLLFTLSCTVQAEGKFKVCADPLNPPYSTKKLDGFENKIAELFAKELGQTVEYTWFPQRIGFIRNTLRVQKENSDEYKCDVVMGVPTGFELAITTKPYYHSTYVMIIAKGRGLDNITHPSQLRDLPLDKLDALKIAMFDRGPGTAWLQKNGLLEQGIPYQTMTGDHENNVAMQIEKDLKKGKIDVVILWGPMAGYVISQSPKNSYTVMPMQSTPGMKFDFSMAMAVRFGDKARQEMLNKLISTKSKEIQQIISAYQIPLLPIPKQPHKDDDD